MEITKVLDSYLGKPTRVALKELPKIARESKIILIVYALSIKL